MSDFMGTITITMSFVQVYMGNGFTSDSKFLTSGKFPYRDWLWRVSRYYADFNTTTANNEWNSNIEDLGSIGAATFTYIIGIYHDLDNRISSAARQDQITKSQRVKAKHIRI